MRTLAVFLLALLLASPVQADSPPLQQSFAALISLAEKNMEGNVVAAIGYAEKALHIAETTANLEDQAIANQQLGILFNRSGEYEKSLTYHKESLHIWEQIYPEKNTLDIAQSQLYICIANWRLGILDVALEACLGALGIFDNAKKQHGIAEALHNIGIVYDYLGNYDLALENHQRALEIRKVLKDNKGIADSLNNIGIIYHLTKRYKEALEYYQESLNIKKSLDDQAGIAKSLNNVGVVLRILKDYEKSLAYLLEAIEFHKKFGDKYEIANTLNNIGQVYASLERIDEAKQALAESLALAQEVDAKEIVRENYEFSAELHERQGDFKTALEFYKKSTSIRNKIFDSELSKQVANLQTKYETDKKIKQIELLKKENDIKQLALSKQKLQRNVLIGGIFFIFALLFFLYSRYNLKKKAHEAISLEKEKTDRLLLNILPARVAASLKETGKTEPESFEHVTVYFSDIAGFTNISSTLDPKTLISELNELFTAFDNIVENNQCERVKTIGDAYLCVCGMPEENINHAYNIVKSATEILAYLEERNRTHPLQWHIRIGIHTGRVVGGVVGIKKYIYDVFGDTINTASRMEANSHPMRINISESTYQLVKDSFQCAPRGRLPVKGKGDMDMYFVDIPFTS